ncbi:MAG: argininosuccinate lyase [Ilumatobacteraceae bacterium]
MAHEDKISGAAGGVAAGSALWHGRFESGPAASLWAHTESLSFDVRLWPDDIRGSLAHVAMLGATGILSSDDVAAVTAALETVSDEFGRGVFAFEPTDEDIHTAIERRVTQLAGDAGARMHTARSRNDQVAAALRLWTKREMSRVAGLVLDVVEVFARRADESEAQDPPLRLPGYTHLQQAQPVLLSHHLRAHCWALLRDVDRIFDALHRLDVSPLGAGALAGTSLPIDPSRTSESLGFARPFANSLDAVSDRDFVAESLFALALLGVHMSRIGEEWVLWTSSEFGFATLDDAYATGSSMLPQKKNADIAELARGKTGRLVGNLVAMLTVLKGLPLSYNRDLQEDKEPLFDSVDQVSRALEAIAGMVDTAVFNSAAMSREADAEALVATDLAEWMVARGVPFRDAHAVVGNLVRRSLEEGVPLRALVEAAPSLGGEAAQMFEPGAALARRTSPGAAGPQAAGVQREMLVAAIAEARGRFA